MRSSIATLRAASDIVAADLDSLCQSLADEFARMAGKRLLITGGAGFLGYYLVQSVAHLNIAASQGQQVDLTVIDSFARGRPQWLVELADRGSVKLVQHNIVEPLAAELGEFDF